MNSEKEAYATIARLTYAINEAAKYSDKVSAVCVTFEESYGVINIQRVHDGLKGIMRTRNTADAIEYLSKLADKAEAELNNAVYHRRDEIAAYVASARELANKSGFDLAQEAWNKIFSECMDNYKKLEENNG